MSDLFDFKAKVSIDRNDAKLTITTKDCEKFLQDNFDRVTKEIRNKGLKDEQNVKIHLSSLKFNKNSGFIPFMIIMSKDVIQKSETLDNVSSIFKEDEDARSCALKKPYWFQLCKYAFDNNDIGYFRSTSWRRDYRMTSQSVNELTKLCKPIRRQNKDEDLVVMIIDPIRVMHDMLTDQGNQYQRFNVEIKKDKSKWISDADGNVEYAVNRVVLKKKDQYCGESIYNQIQRQIIRNGSPR